MSGYKGKLTDYILREDAIRALCKSTCYRGVFCPDEYCCEVRIPFDDIPAADVIPIVRTQPTSSDKPERLTDDDFETIRIHLSAFKESLCNQGRWREAEDYERLINRFMSFASAQEVE